MAKRKKEQADALRARRQGQTNQRSYMLNKQEQTQFRAIRLAVIGVIGLIAALLIGGLVFDYAIKPGQPVAEITNENNANVTNIVFSEWRSRAQFERHRTLAQLDELYDAVGGDINQLYQYAGQQFTAIQDPKILGRQVLDNMIDEQLLNDEAAARGLEVSDAEVDAEIAERFDFYGGELPPATEVPTETPVPTPSVTPIGAVPTITPSVTLTPTLEPTPMPTQTPTSQESFDEQYQETISEYETWGLGEAYYRDEIRTNLLVEKLRDSFGETGELTVEEEKYSFYSIVFQSEEDAQQTFADIEANGLITTWNTIKSAGSITESAPFASEVQWTTFETISRSFGTAVADFVQTTEVGTTSAVLETNEDADNPRWFILNLRDREMQALTDAELDSQKMNILGEWLDDKRQDVVIHQGRYESNSPKKPRLSQKFYLPQPEAPMEDSIETTDDG